MTDIKYCSICSSELGIKEIGDEGPVKYCHNCNKAFFDNAIPCVEVLVVNEYSEAVLLKQNYVSQDKWTIVAGYIQKGETLEEAAIREVLEETGQEVLKLEYVASYYFEPKGLIMPGFLAHVAKAPFSNSNEVDDIMWCKLEDVNSLIARVDNMSGMHYDNCMKILSEEVSKPCKAKHR